MRLSREFFQKSVVSTPKKEYNRTRILKERRRVSMEQFKNLTERYCPKLGGNVPLENMYDDEGNVYMRCLFSYKCTWYECEKHMPAFPNR